MLTFQTQVLQRVVGTIADDECRFAAGPVVVPNAVGGIEFTLPGTWSAAAALPVTVLVVEVDEIGTVAVGEEEIAVGEKGKIRGHETVAAPDFLRMSSSCGA